jgi:rfaE bifunctional protein nucleotidyltransferase chain/domain
MRIKGSKRPILKEAERGFIILNLKPVDYVVLFDEDTPKLLIEKLLPDILVKGADWEIENIVGKDVVIANGGEVNTIEFVNDQSTSKIIKIIVDRFKD